MSTLSQRLRDLRIGLFPDIETVNAVLDECIAQAEALEAQAGELSDEVIKRILNANTYEDLNNSRQGGYVTSSDHDAYDMGMIAGLKYARDKGYPKPSQTTPVITHLNMDPNASPETIEAVEDVVQKAYSYKPPSQAIGEQTPVATNPIIGNARQRWKELGNDDPERVAERYRGDPWRIFYTGWTEGRAPLVIQLNDNHRLFTEARDSLAEYRDTYRSPLSPEARDKAIHALQVSRITHKAMCREDHVDMIDDAISALRGQ